MCLNMHQMFSKNYAIFLEVRVSLKVHIGSQGGGQEGPKKDHIIFERSIMVIEASEDPPSQFKINDGVT